VIDGVHELLPAVRRVHERIRDGVVAACERASLATLSGVERDGAGDTIYAIDKVSEDLLVSLCSAELAEIAPLVLIAEGLDEPLVLPRGTPEQEARWRVIVDPIDGTRGLMYQKRSAWILTGVAENRGPATRLSDIVLAVQTEIPLVKQHLSDAMWAIRGDGAGAERFNRVTGEASELHLAPSTATTIEHGFAQIARFFPGARDVLAAIDEEIARGALGPLTAGKAQYFEDQYISNAGQLYEVMAGHDRFVADLRPLMTKVLAKRGETLGICAHPYDLCTELIARELGVEVGGVSGEQLDAPLALETDIAWIAYANRDLRRQIEPLLVEALGRRGLLPE